MEANKSSIPSDFEEPTINDYSNFQDPFLKDGGELVYEEEHDFVIRMQQKPNQIETLKNMERLRVKILITEEHGLCKDLKIQLTSDAELYFNFVFTCTDWEFKRIRQNQHMFIEFKQYPEIILKNFHKLNEKDSKLLAVFTVYTEKQGKLDIIRKAQFRDDSILEFQFYKPSEEIVKESIQYRYDLMKREHEAYLERYEDITEVVRANNPSLMMQINKNMKKTK